MKKGMAFALLLALLMTGCGMQSSENAGTGNPESSASISETEEAALQPETQDASGMADAASYNGCIETISYSINYEGMSYNKEAYVYVPQAYDASKPMNVLYLMHGSTGSGEQMADAMKSLLDGWIQDGQMKPLLVVFPTYYPDRTFVVSNYSEDYPLNHFFATQEVTTLVRAVEEHYHSYAQSTDEQSLESSRMHRAFGGYSMGGVTTWDVLAYQAPYFGYYLPMAGDCWLDQAEDVPPGSDISDLLVQGLKDGGYSSEDFRIIAMVGGSDGTKYSMQPQIEALRKEHPELITDDNLIYWENEGGGHSQQSMELEVEHGLQYLWTE